MSPATPVIIEVAINGNTPKAMNPNVPVSPPEIATEMKALLAAGASIIHSHIEDKTTGQVAADRYMEGWAPVFKAFPDAVLCSTSTRAPTFEEKWLHMELLAEQGMSMGVIDPGSVNLADSGAHGLPGPRAMVHANSFAEIDYGMKLLARHQLGPSIAIFEPGFLRTTLAYERAGTLPPGALCKLYFGGDYNWFDGKRSPACFGLPPTRTALDAYLEMLHGSRLAWSVALIGGDLIKNEIAEHALRHGGHLRIGLEDYVDDTEKPTNMALLQSAIDLCARVGRPVANAAETRALLGLPR